MILVLGNCEESKKSLEAINRLFFKRACDMQLAKPEYTTERTWYFLDELTEAGKLEGLVSLMKKGRSKGARVVIAFQTISGLRDPSNFGQYMTDEVLGQIGCRFFGRIECPETAEYASKILGEQEFIQQSNSYTYGQHGSSTTSYQNMISRTVLPSEFLTIPSLSRDGVLYGYVTLPDIGCTRVGIPSSDLFGYMLFPPDLSIPDFVPREVKHQFLRPWTAEELAIFAPASKKPNSISDPSLPKKNPPFSQNLDDLLN